MAGKRKVATKVEVFYIKENPEGKSSQELADELCLFKTTVEKILIEKGLEQEEEVEIKVEEPLPKKRNKMEGFITSRSQNGNGGVAVMQEAGSSRLDDFRKNANISNKNLPCIVKIRPEE
jgi:hypothetical protein